MSPTNRRGDIEGLRAVAVTLVVAYHCGLTGFGGGFIGVDVFFALSGFLMTGLLLDERLGTGSIGLVAFYARRIRRLLPAAAVATLATLVAGVVVLDPLALRRLMGDVIAVATYSANLRFARQGTDYLLSDVGTSPLLHHWSLAVEEQFYLVWPVVLLLATRTRRGRATLTGRAAARRVAFALGTLTVVSFGLSLALTHPQPVWSFYALHTRMWEFGLGGLAAVGGRLVGQRLLRVRGAAGWVGLGAIAVSTVTFGHDIPYPGWHAAVPVLATAFVLDAFVCRAGPRRVLDRRALVWIGGRSYSIYLWHWPPLVLVPIALERPLTPAEAVAVTLAASVAAIGVQAAVEDPLRRATVLVGRVGATYTMGAGIMVLLVIASVSVSRSIDLSTTGAAAGEPVFVDGSLQIDEETAAPASGGDPAGPGAGPDTPRSAPANLAPPLGNIADDRPSIYDTGCHVDIPATELSDCRIGTGSSTIALLGDSHAAQWFPALEGIAARNGAALTVFTKSGCPAATVSIWNPSLGRDYVECDAWREAALTRLEDDPPDVVVVAGYPRPTLKGGEVSEGPVHEAAWRTGLDATLARLESTGARVLLIAPTPRSAGRRPQCVAENRDDIDTCTARRVDVEQQPYLSLELEAARVNGAASVDPTDWVCGDTVCPAVIGRYLVYRDSSHLTTPFVRSLTGVLEPHVAALLPP